jgi:hypothetical protein
MIRFEDQIQRALNDANVEPYHARVIFQLCADERRRAFIEGLRRGGRPRQAGGWAGKPSAVQAGIMRKAERPGEAVRREVTAA